MNFQVTFCDPFKSDLVDLGTIERNNILELFDSINWNAYLVKMKGADETEVFYSPSLRLTLNNTIGLEISAVGENMWYSFFKRPKEVKTFFGLYKKMDDKYTTVAFDHTEKDVRECLTALINNDLEFLDKKIK